MLNFEEFCLKVSEDFMKYISASFSAENGYHAVVKDVVKNGKTFRVLLIDSPDKAIKPPVVPLDRLYDSIFLKKYNGDVVSTLKEIAASYEKNYTKAVEISEEVVKFIVEEWKLKDKIDGIISVPPSKFRFIQPMFQVTKLVGEKLNKPISLDFFSKLTPEEIKNLPVEKKLDLFKNSIRKNRSLTKKGSILLIDDLYSTGVTLKTLCELLKEDSNVENIYVLVVAKSSKED